MTTITVTNLNDNGNGSLRQAIADAGAGDTIDFAANLASGTLTLTGGVLDITQSVTIEGDIDGNGTPDITISGGNTSEVFDVSGGTSTLDGLVVTGGQAALGGGVYIAGGGTLTVMNSTVTGNTATNDGGGIDAAGTLTLVNSTVSDNSAFRGGGISASATTQVTNSTISGNTALYGAGIYASTNATLGLSNSALADNTASGSGGGIANLGALTLVDSMLSGNYAHFGGGVFNDGGTVALTSSTLSGNSTAPSGKGGGILGFTGTLTLTNATLSGNSAGGGGGIYSNGTLTLTNATLSGNSAQFGGGIDYRGNTTLVDSIDAGNAAGIIGSDLYSGNNASLTLTGGNIVGGTFSIDGTTARTGIALSDIFAPVTANPYTHIPSGTLANNGGAVETVALNASASNPAIDAGDDALAPATDARGFARSDFPGAANNGTNISDLGAYEVSHQIVVTTLDDVAQPSGGLVSLREALALANNSPGAQTTITFDPTLYGGTLTLTTGELVITNNVSIDGDINGDGTPDITISGGNTTAVLYTAIGGNIHTTLNGLVIENGYASHTYGFGGGVFVGDGDSLTLTNSTIADSSAFKGGGIFVSNNASLTMLDSTVAGNSASASGGGIFGYSGATLTLTNATLSGNEAHRGGGIGGYQNDQISLTNTTLTGNEAYNGGGIFAYQNNQINLTNTTLSGNDATHGGGIFGQNDQISLTNTTLSGNEASHGGGIFGANDQITLSNTTLTGNRATVSNGGGIYTVGSSAVTTITNSIVAGNSSASTGYDLDGNGGAKLVFGGDNIVGSAPAISSIDKTNGSYTQIDGTSQSDLQSVFAQVGNNPTTGVLSGLPAGNGASIQTVALNPTGIAIDAGVTADVPPGTTTDERGFSRVVGSSVDIGAFEQQAPQTFVVTTLNDELDSTDSHATLADESGGNGLSLREALFLANEDPTTADTITFDPTLYGGTLTLSLGQLVIGSDVTIDGDIDGNGTPDIAIDGNYASRVFAAQAGNATLDGLFIEDGNADYGGGLRIYGGASVDVTNSNIGYNNASNAGGGVSVAQNGVLALNSSQVGRNTAADGGGIDIASGSATITNSNIYLNTGSSDGGGIWANTAATIALTNVAVADNTTYGSGGGIYFAGNGALALTNATLTGNYSAAEGGAISAYRADVALTNSTLTGNYASSGGGIYANQADVTLGNSIVAGNGAYASAADLSDSSPASSHLHFFGHNIIGSAVTDFATVDTANGSYTQIDGTSQTDLQKVFAQVGHDPNTGVLSGVLANNGGGVATVALNPTGIAVDAGVTADAVYDADNNPATPDVPIPTDARGFSRDVGSSVDIGAFEQQAPQSFVVTTLDDELDSTNPNATIADMGGPNDLSLREALFLANEDPTTADTVTFANDLSGGTIDLTLGQLKLTGGVTIDGDINGNNTPAITIDAEGSSRVIDARYGTSTINGLAMTGGYGFIGGAVEVGSLSGYGSADVTISNSAITGNNAAYGGGIAVNYGSSLQLTNTYVATNYAYLVGGGIANQGSLTLTNSIVNDNTSGYIGGGIASDNTLTVIGSTLSNNKTGGVGPGLPPHYYYRGGGGLYNSGSARLINTTISGNKGGYAGGGIYNSEALTLINVTLANNSADYGGGLSNAACGCGNVSIYDTTITGNAATGHYGGGGIANAGGTLTLANSIVAGNGAPGQGPDIYAYAAITYSGVNLFSQLGIGRLGTDIYISPPDLAEVFTNLTTIDPDGVPNSGDEFLAGTLANNGGPVETVLITQRGAAQNTGDNTALPLDPDNPDQQLPTDARGETRVFDGTVDIGALELQVLLSPVVTATASNINASASENFTPSELFSASTSVGDPIVSYEVQDETSGPNNGFWVLNGAVLPNGQITTLSAAQLAELIFVAGSDSAPVADTLEVAAANAAGLGAFTTFTVTAAPHEASAPPVVTAANELQTPDLTLAASSLFSATASGGNSIASYEVEDTTAGSGHWEFNGVTEPTNQVVYVTAAQLSQLNFVTGYGSDTLMVRANDGSQWGSFTSFTVTAPPNPPPPPGTSADLITFRPATGDYAIYDFVHNATPAVHLLTDIPAPWQTVGLGNFSGSGTSDMLLRNTTTGVFEIVDVSNNNASAPILLGAVGLEWQVAGFGDFSSHPGETDMLMRNVNNGNFELYDFSNNNVPFATALSGAVGLNEQVFGFGDFSGKPNETDMLMRDVNTDIVELVDFSNNAVTSVTQLGALGLEWQFAGAGDFSSRPGETDLLARNANNGDFELYDFQNGQVTAAIALGNAGLEWQVAGFADFSGNPNETDMLMRNTNTGQFEVVDFSNNAVSAVVLLGDVGLEWQVVGTAPYQATAGATAASDQSLSHSASSVASDPLGASDWLTQAMQTSSAANQPLPAGMGMGAAPAAGTSPVSGPGFDAGSDLLAGAAPAASLAMANPLQPHTG